MLTGYDTQTVAFYVRDNAEFLCPGCASKQYGSLVVERARMGLSRDPLEAVPRWSAEDQATANGYDYAEDRGDQDGFLALVAELLCPDCGTVLARDGRHPRALERVG